MALHVSDNDIDWHLVIYSISLAFIGIYHWSLLVVTSGIDWFISMPFNG